MENIKYIPICSLIVFDAFIIFYVIVLVCMNPSSDAAASIWCVSTLSSNGIMSSGKVSETCWKYLVLVDIPGSLQISSHPSLKCCENKACTSIIVPRPLVNASQCGPIRVIPW